MLERISINGFLRAFRCVGLGGTNVNDKYFIIYDLRSKDILLSKYYLNRLYNLAVWTSKFYKINIIHRVLFVK